MSITGEGHHVGSGDGFHLDFCSCSMIRAFLHWKVHHMANLKRKTSCGVSTNGDTPIAGWFRIENLMKNR